MKKFLSAMMLLLLSFAFSTCYSQVSLGGQPQDVIRYMEQIPFKVKYDKGRLFHFYQINNGETIFTYMFDENNNAITALIATSNAVDYLTLWERYIGLPKIENAYMDIMEDGRVISIVNEKNCPDGYRYCFTYNILN